MDEGSYYDQVQIKGQEKCERKENY